MCTKRGYEIGYDYSLEKNVLKSNAAYTELGYLLPKLKMDHLEEQCSLY
jgi:hypothetical protein